MKNARFDCQGPLSNWSNFDGGSSRRDLVLASLFSLLPTVALSQSALASKLNPSETQITLPADIEWGAWTALHHTLAKWRLFMVVWTSPDLISC